jgi:hypothetical protein
MAHKKRVPPQSVDSEEGARALDAFLALQGILAGTDAEEFLAESRRQDEEKLEAMIRGEVYVRPE